MVSKYVIILLLSSFSHAFWLTNENNKDYIREYLKSYREYIFNTISDIRIRIRNYKNENIGAVLNVQRSLVLMQSAAYDVLDTEINETLSKSRRIVDAQDNDFEHCYVAVTVKLKRVTERTKRCFSYCEEYYTMFDIPGSEIATEMEKKGEELLDGLDKIIVTCAILFFEYDQSNCVINRVEEAKIRVSAFDRDYETVVAMRDAAYQYMLDRSLLCLQQCVISAKTSVAKVLNHVPHCINGTDHSSEEEVDNVH
ncbi:hypothetical protein KM043_018590 [Ampulex compressa]|uniref:Venom protein n=1 Tax=Ampulex compressa TaxID=860918 RepID=A0A1W6EW25_AMPCP|nr:venom protein [Ampulex compressa]KAG7202255.1 hypothetical protein KM043_018590 [Ampulex compressa]